MDSHSLKHPKINPGRRRPDGSPDDNDRVETGPTGLAFAEWQERGLVAPDLERMRAHRLSRICAQLQKNDYAGALLFDPLNIRYATDCTNMSVWTMHNFARAAFVSADGYVVLWDFHASDHLSSHLPLIREVRGGAGFFYFETGDKTDEVAASFADQINDLLTQHGGGSKQLAVDKMEIAGLEALRSKNIQVQSGQQVMEHARVIKSIDEINAMRCAIATCEIAVAKMEKEIQPGITENELWAHLHMENIRRGGEWIETRILSSGPRTNPWMQECGPRIIGDGDIVAFDTDLVGPYGMCADISRTWVCGDKPPTSEMQNVYRLAHEHVQTNMELLRPGVSFRDLSFGGHQLPEEFIPQRYGVKMHGIGLCDEYPAIYYPQDYIEGAFDYEVEAGMTFCVEVYAGTVGSSVGVKLEEQVLVTDSGYECLTSYPFDARLLGQ